MAELVRNIVLRGARQHNLKGIDLDFALGKLTVVCGVSGSGKTSLALNTLYAEGQRRYIESFSAYSRQFLQRIEKPSFDSLTNLPPSIALTREVRTRNNRSTVGTASEILEFMRVCFANHGQLECYKCSRRVLSHNPRSVCDFLLGLKSGKLLLCFEIRWQTKSELSEILFDLQTDGFVRLVVLGQFVHLAEEDRNSVAKSFDQVGQAYVVVDRLTLGTDIDQDRLMQSLATVFGQTDELGGSGAVALVQTSQRAGDVGTAIKEELDIEKGCVEIAGVRYVAHRFSSLLRCQHCEIDYPASESRLFSFNSPVGACATCEGFGEVVSIDKKKIVPDESLSLNQGAVAVWRTPAYCHELEELREIAKEMRVPMDVPVSELTPKQWQVVQEGSPKHKFGGLNGFFAWLERKKYKMHVRVFLTRWRTYSTCPDCHGRRLNQGALAYKMFGKNFAELCDVPVEDLHRLFSEYEVNRGSNRSGVTVADSEPDATPFLMAGEARSRYLATEPERQLVARLDYLKLIGLGYLCLARPLHTLSSGEAQRVMMTTLLGSSLVDMLYVFDEPTVGLHPQDTERMAAAILGLRDRGNTVVLVEHEPHLMKIADRIVEIGPQAGDHGGSVVFNGTPKEMISSDSVTGRYLGGKSDWNRTPRSIGQGVIGIRGAYGRNLQVEELSIPLGCLTVVIGPSGAGKSSLILETLCPAIETAFGEQAGSGLPYESRFGMDMITGCLAIDQSPIPRSIRSSPVTYSKAMDDIRQAYADSPDAKSRRLDAGHFSFNSAVGRCPTCEGLGFVTVDMQFMADIQLPCQDCDGKRFRAEVLEVRLRDLNIAEVLELSIDRAHAFFRGNSKVQEKLRPLLEIGLGYLPLGRSLSTLSAGESMRLKLASQLSFGSPGNAPSKAKGKLIVLDEPTTGLHFSDIERLLQCIDMLIDTGNSVVIIEHNQQLICSADHVIELGPGAGQNGGKIIAQGVLDLVRRNPRSVTGPFLGG